MLAIDTLWFEVSIMSTAIALGQILLGHFEEHTPKWRRALKIFLGIGLGVLVSATLGRAWFFGMLGLLLSAVLYIHLIWLPRHGINGWTAEPKAKYYELRGWTNDSSKT